MLDQNRCEDLLKRSRHGAGKRSSVAVSATELARLVCRRHAFGIVGRTLNATRNRAWQRSKVVTSAFRAQQRNNCSAITKRRQRAPASYSLNSSVMRLQRAKTRGLETILTQRSLSNESAVAESNFDDILDVGAPCPQNPHTIMEQ